MGGKYFEEFAIGQTFVHEVRRTVTDMDNILFSTLTHNPAAIHIDHEYAKTTEFGKPLVNSIFTLGLVVGLSVLDTTLGTTVGNLGWEEVAFPKPVFAGDTIHAETTVIALRELEVAPDAGDRDLRAQGNEPAQRGGLLLPTRRADAEEAPMKLRSLLFVPGNSERKFAKAQASGADALILDLEDSVAPAQKAAARAHVASLLEKREPRDWSFFVRINALDTALTLDDLAAVVKPGLDGVLVPKANGVEDIVHFGHYLDAFETKAGMPVGSVKIAVVATETAKAMFALTPTRLRIRGSPR